MFLAATRVSSGNLFVARLDVHAQMFRRIYGLCNMLIFFAENSEVFRKETLASKGNTDEKRGKQKRRENRVSKTKCKVCLRIVGSPRALR